MAAIIIVKLVCDHEFDDKKTEFFHPIPSNKLIPDNCRLSLTHPIRGKFPLINFKLSEATRSFIGSYEFLVSFGKGGIRIRITITCDRNADDCLYIRSVAFQEYSEDEYSDCVYVDLIEAAAAVPGTFIGKKLIAFCVCKDGWVKIPSRCDIELTYPPLGNFMIPFNLDDAHACSKISCLHATYSCSMENGDIIDVSVTIMNYDSCLYLSSVQFVKLDEEPELASELDMLNLGIEQVD